MPIDPSEGVVVYTDGSAWTKDRSGGWAWCAIDAFGGEELECGSSDDTTNNRMEMTAVNMALAQLFFKYGACDVQVVSDSEYIVLGIQDPTRKRNNNYDLWAAMENAIALHDHVEFTHVKGHNKDYYNDWVDQLAGEARVAPEMVTLYNRELR